MKNENDYHRVLMMTEVEEGRNIYVLDDQLCYTFFNEFHRTEMKSRFSADIALGAYKPDFLPSPLNEDYRQIYERALNGLGFRHVAKFENSFFEFVLYPMTMPDQSKELLIKTREITDQIRLNQELEKYRDGLESDLEVRTKEISDQRNFFQLLIDEDPSLVFVRDGQGYFRLVNQTLADAMNMTKEELIDSSMRESMSHANDIERYHEEDLKIINEGITVSDITEVVLHNQGKIWLSVTKKRITVNDEPMILGVMSNITDLVNTKEQLESSNTALQQSLDEINEMQLKLVTSEKIASILLLTGGLMHEINNPINYVSGNVDPLREDIDELIHWLNESGYMKGNPKAEEDFKVIQQEIDTLLNGISEGSSRVRKLAHNLKAISSTQEDEKSMCQLDEVIEGILAMLSLMIEQKGIIIRRLFTPDSSLIFTNPNYLHQIFINILDYVVVRMKEGSELFLSLVMNESSYLIEILDESKGITEQEIKSMVDPFNATTENTKMGLAVSHKIAQKIGGNVEVQESNDRTHFKIILPSN